VEKFIAPSSAKKIQTGRRQRVCLATYSQLPRSPASSQLHQHRISPQHRITTKYQSHHAEISTGTSIMSHPVEDNNNQDVAGQREEMRERAAAVLRDVQSPYPGGTYFNNTARTALIINLKIQAQANRLTPIITKTSNTWSSCALAAPAGTEGAKRQCRVGYT